MQKKGAQEEWNITFVLLVINLVWSMSMTWHQTHRQREMADSHMQQQCSRTHHDNTVSQCCNPVWQDRGAGRGPGNNSSNATLSARLQSISNRIYAHSRSQHRLKPQTALHSLYISHDWQRQTESAFGRETSVLIPLSWNESCSGAVVKW